MIGARRAPACAGRLPEVGPPRSIRRRPRDLVFGHVGIVRHALKKAGVGSKVGSRSRRNVRILVEIIAQLIFFYLSIPTAIAVIIIAMIVLVPGRST